MFYSHAILTSREHGIATVWLVATLGSKSSLKTLTRRKILDVDVHRACDTIRNPESPMALRLQGSLLYGVTRVHSQQCEYVLGDVQAMRDKVRGASVVVKELALDPELGRTRPDQLNLPDDPAFAPDFDLTIDLSTFNQLPIDLNGRASLLSPPSLVSSRSSQRSVEINGVEEPGLELPSGDTSLGAGLQDFDPGFGVGPGLTSVERTRGISVLGEETGIVDVGWEFDEHGNMIDTTQAPKSPAITSAGHVKATGLIPDTTISARVRREHAEGMLAAQQVDNEHYYFGEGMLGLGEDDQLLSEARPFSPRHQIGYATFGPEPEPTSSGQPGEEELPSPVVLARQRRAPVPKPIEPDASTGLTNGQLRQWDERYVDHMQEAAAAKRPYKAAQQAKKNAEYWVLGLGIGEVGSGLGQDHTWSPLQMFSGESLLAALTGRELSPLGRKHGRSPSVSSTAEDEDRRVRAREEPKEQTGRGPHGQEPTLAGQDEGGIFVGGDETDVEVGRIGVEDLPERLSSRMPWDTYSASRHGSARPLERGTIAGISSSLGGPDLGFELGPHSALSRRRGSRITSASPLQGRGPPVPLSQRISIVSSITDGDILATTSGALGDEGDEMVFGGDTSAVDRPTNQLAAAALDSESRNFLDYLDAQIQMAGGDGRGEVEGEDAEDIYERPPTAMATTFETVIPPTEHTKAVAAQAFLHVLTLVSKNLLWVRQAEEDFGDIELAISVEG